MGDEGGFAPDLSGEQEAIELILEAVERAGYKPGEDFVLALDAAASEWKAPDKRGYFMPKKKSSCSAEELIEEWKGLCSRYPIVSIEDPWDDDGGLVIDFQPGMQHMDGAKAITYVRYRDEEGDLGRIRRQQDFVKACLDKIISPAILPKLPSVIREVMSSIKTDLSLRQFLEFAGTLKEAKGNGLKTDMVPGRPLYIDGVSYWIPDLNQLRTTIADTLGLSLNAKYRSRMENDIQEYERSIPSTAREVPASDTSIGHMKKSSKTQDSSHRRSELREDTSEHSGRTSAGSGSSKQSSDSGNRDSSITSSIK